MIFVAFFADMAPVFAQAGGAATRSFCFYRCVRPRISQPNVRVSCAVGPAGNNACKSACETGPDSCPTKIAGSTCATNPAPACTATGCSYHCDLGQERIEMPAASISCTEGAGGNQLCAQACAAGTQSCSTLIPGTTCATSPAPRCGNPPAEEGAGGAATSSPTGGTQAGSSETLENPLGENDLSKIIGRIIKAVVGVVGAVALLMFVIGGALWMTAAGNDKQYETAKSMMTNSIIGLLLIFFAYTIVSSFYALF